MPEDKGLSRSQREEKVLQFWKDNQIFEKSLEKKSPEGDFVFYEGPPTANGKPAIHHLEARAFKDAIPRYKTMRGFRVNRKAGWDTHGLPVEIEAEKTLGLKSKKEIEEYGVEKFNAECKSSVSKYIDEWKTFTERMGYWVNFDDAYFTYHNSYIESVWGIIGQTEKKKLLYKDYRVVPWCPRCGTALSSHELAQGYEDVKDLSLYVKFKIVGFPDAYFLAWTTTPWTLPGNVALAVGPNITYVEAKVGNEILVLAKERLSIIKEPYEIIAEHKGSEMVGMEYEPLYNFIENNSKAFKVYPADFVTTEDGTGIVHTAVMYGQEDFELGTKIGLPKQHLVSPDGTFIKHTGWLEGRSVVDSELAVDILKDLKERGLLFDKENYTHSYPFCWRCKTRLIYYARDSWYIRMSELRDKLVRENQRINWEPEYIKEGRFGEWLREVKDWAISRERYWGTPLPVWQSEDGERIVVDSVETLKKYTKKSGNKYFAVRHGESEKNTKGVCDSTVSSEYHLTEKGRNEALQAGKKLKKQKIDLIICSPFIRTKETAEIIAEQVGLDKKDILIDDRLFELRWGDFEGGPYSAYLEYEEKNMKTYDHKLPNGESYQDAKNRVGELLYEVDSKYKDKNVLFVSHGIMLEVIPAITEGADAVRSKEIIDKLVVETGDILEFDFVQLPHNNNFELDLHKPFIDEVVLEKGGKEYRRVKEVMDVWLDSGAVPFAQDPENIVFPADFISEAIDQTRGWFYSLHAVGVLMDKGRAFKNVICLGHLMDKEGKKMSKSKGNVVEPFEMIEKYGVDALRMWMYSVNQPGESKNFDEKTVEEINRKVFNLVDNVHAFYELYAGGEKVGSDKSGNILDQWIFARLSELTNMMTMNLEGYKLLEPTRALRDFIDDLSTWYLRRSRDRLKEGDKEARETLYFVLKTVSKLLAPFAPFYAEDLYQKLRTEADVESVHLESWPFAESFSARVLEKMQRTRDIVSEALEARSKANIKVRQPLASLTAHLDGAYLDLIKDEVNVKEVIDKKIEGVELDTKLTPELVEEGKVRDIIRAIQEMRKEKNLRPSDVMEYKIVEDRELFEKYKREIEKVTNIRVI
jgi:isoleucyl-tRNA synthetase